MKVFQILFFYKSLQIWLWFLTWYFIWNVELTAELLFLLFSVLIQRLYSFSGFFFNLMRVEEKCFPWSKLEFWTLLVGRKHSTYSWTLNVWVVFLARVKQWICVPYPPLQVCCPGLAECFMQQCHWRLWGWENTCHTDQATD